MSSLRTDSAVCKDDELWARSCTCVSVKLTAGGGRPVVQWVFSTVTGSWCADPAVRYLADHQPMHVATEQTS